MTDLDPSPLAGPDHFFRGQAIHALYLAALLPAAAALAAPALDAGDWLGLSVRTWFWLCVGGAVVHQVVVWAVWRGQLCFLAFTRAFGERDLMVWAAVFFPFLVSRPLLVAAVAAADPGSLALPRWLSASLGAALLVPALYTLVSVERYFGPRRASGADHFRRRFRELPIVRQGAFAWTDNAMYVLAFLGLWSIALLAGSHTALVAVLFQHAYIQVHWIATERPDMQLLYGDAT
jgi:protein-S-isoprenylcysteine O-methyltransferase Ste14